jgi:hypothetical protein
MVLLLSLAQVMDIQSMIHSTSSGLHSCINTATALMIDVSITYERVNNGRENTPKVEVTLGEQQRKVPQ